jgi:hypothetical protein
MDLMKSDMVNPQKFGNAGFQISASRGISQGSLVKQVGPSAKIPWHWHEVFSKLARIITRLIIPVSKNFY